MRVGIVGGGQLARMLALAAYPLGYTVTVLDGTADATAGRVAPLIHGNFSDREALGRLAEASDVVTFDFENVPAASAEWLAARVAVHPGPPALAAAQDRVVEKSLFRDLGIPTPAFAAVDSIDDLDAALACTGLPAVLKTRRFGYDGKGQRVVRDPEAARVAVTDLGGSDLILESFVPFQRELSVLVARGADGKVATYPVTENVHRDGILHTSIAPAPASPHSDEAHELAKKLATELRYVGVLALELFECADGLLANEFAPRVHNSGHWTIEGAVTSQFENHLRAVTGQPLGDVSARGHAAMLNFIGRMPDRAAALRVHGVHLHDYAKQPRPGRKVGHATVCADDAAGLQRSLEELLALDTR